MKVYIIVIAMYFIIVLSVFATDDNIEITNSEDVYELIVDKKGYFEKVKVKLSATYTALRIADVAIATEFYNDNITIDKASAPGAKPRYRQWISEDIFYDDSKVCQLVIPINKKGTSVKAVFEKTYTKVEQFTSISFPEIYPIKNKTVKIIVPKELKDKINVIEKSFTTAITMEIKDGQKGEKIYTYTIVDMPAVSIEEYMPSLSTIMPRVYITGLFNDYQELYKYLYDYTINHNEDSNELATFAQKLVENCTNDRQKVVKLTEWVQKHIRYIAIEHGEYGHRPDKAIEVYNKRYGDCKGMSSLLKTMMIAVGLDARLVWIGTDVVGSDWKEIPSLCSGNHMICAVMLGDEILYVDGTSTYLPVGCYDTSIQGRTTLIEAGDTCILSKVPIQSVYCNTDSATMNWIIDENDLRGRVSRVLTGTRKMYICGTYHAIDASKRTEFLDSYIAYPKKNVDVDSLKIEGDEVQSLQTEVVANVVEKDACQNLGDIIYVDLQPLRNPYMEPIKVKDRKNSIKFTGLFRYVSNVNVKIPENFVVSALPELHEVSNKWFTSKILYFNEGNELKCKAEVVMNNQVVKISELEEWYEAIREFVRANNVQIVLKKI